MSTRKEIRKVWRGFCAFVNLLAGIMPYVITAGLLATFFIGCSELREGHLIMGLRCIFIIVSALLTAIFFAIKDRPENTTVRIRLPKDFMKTGGASREELMKAYGMENNDDKIQKRHRLPSLTSIINEWQDWSMLTFPKSTATSCVAHLKTEVKEFEDAVNERDAGQALKEGVDVILSTLSGLRRLGFKASDVYNGIVDKFEVNRLRQWRLNDDNTYSHIKPGAQISFTRVVYLLESLYKPMDFAYADLYEKLHAMWGEANVTDADLLASIVEYFNDADGPQLINKNEYVDNYNLPFEKLDVGMKVSSRVTLAQGTIISFDKVGVNAQVQWLNFPTSDVHLSSIERIDHFTEELKPV